MLVGRHRTIKIVTLAVVLGAHLVWLLEWRIPIGFDFSTLRRDGLTKIAVELVQTESQLAAPAVQPRLTPHSPSTTITERVPAENVLLEYQNSDQLDTRSAPRLNWNIDKQLLVRGEPTALVFTVWVSAAGVIDALEPHTRNGQSWSYDGLARALQETLMVPASLRTQPVASTMTIELTADNDD